MRPRSIFFWFATLVCAAFFSLQAADRPNILWITSEDNGPHLGAYGDEYADTPNLDGLAKRGLMYLNAWSTAPVCAPARTTIISGMYPPSLGAQHMRSMTRLPDGMRMFPAYLRDLGYYCANNSKEDYNLSKADDVWDESSGRAHWKNRADGQPFFAVFNHTVSHESQIRRRPHEPKHDPAKVRIPAYHPDTPESRQDWAQYHDKMTEMDERVGANLRELEEAGLADDTIIFYYGDHGSGMPRSKRWPYNSGLRVPLIVHIPEKFRDLRPDEYSAGGASERLVGFVDLAPTILSLAGMAPPEHMQGHAFMGRHEAPEQPFLFAFRDRMDERYDLVRSVRDERYIYIRQYMPHRIYGQHINYMFQTPTTRVWREMHDRGELNEAQSRFWEPKPFEELYDLEADPDEVMNLAESDQHRDTLRKFRQAHRRHVLEIRDLGFLPEGEIHERAGNDAPYIMGQDLSRYPLEEILPVAQLAASGRRGLLPLREAMRHDDSAVRYWGAMGILIRGEEGVRLRRGILRQKLGDESPYVRIVAAEALGRFGRDVDLPVALDTLMELASIKENGLHVSMMALNALDYLEEKAESRLDEIKALPESADGVNGRLTGYVPRLLEKIVADLAPQSSATATDP